MKRPIAPLPFLASLSALALCLPAAGICSDLGNSPAVPPRGVVMVMHIRMHPLVLGSLSEPGNPVTGSLSDRIREMGAGLMHYSEKDPARLAADYLTFGHTDVLHPDRHFSAMILSRLLMESNPDVVSVLPRLERQALAEIKELLSASSDETSLARLAALAESSRKSPIISHYFDGAAGTARAPSLELDDIQAYRGGLKRKDGTPMDFLGSGDFGWVYAHPTMDAVIKLTRIEAGAQLLHASLKDKEVADKQEAWAKHLAKPRLGPRYLGRTVLSGKQVSVRERIFGETVASLIAARRYGRKEHRLFRDLLKRLAHERLWVNLHPDHVMIGYTRLDPTPRAYIIGDEPVPVEGGISEKDLVKDFYKRGIILREYYVPDVGLAQDAKPLRQILKDGLARYRTKSPWQRFVDAIRAWLPW